MYDQQVGVVIGNCCVYLESVNGNEVTRVGDQWSRGESHRSQNSSLHRRQRSRGGSPSHRSQGLSHRSRQRSRGGSTSHRGQHSSLHRKQWSRDRSISHPSRQGLEADFPLIVVIANIRFFIVDSGLEADLPLITVNVLLIVVYSDLEADPLSS